MQRMWAAGNKNVFRDIVHFDEENAAVANK